MNDVELVAKARKRKLTVYKVLLIGNIRERGKTNMIQARAKPNPNLTIFYYRFL